MSAEDLRTRLAEDRAMRKATQDLRNFVRKQADPKAAKPTSQEKSAERVQYAVATLPALHNPPRTPQGGATPAGGTKTPVYVYKDNELVIVNFLTA